MQYTRPPENAMKILALIRVKIETKSIHFIVYINWSKRTSSRANLHTCYMLSEFFFMAERRRELGKLNSMKRMCTCVCVVYIGGCGVDRTGVAAHHCQLWIILVGVERDVMRASTHHTHIVLACMHVLMGQKTLKKLHSSRFRDTETLSSLRL